MIKIDQIMAFRAQDVDLDNYQIINRYTIDQGDLRVDRQGKFYILTQAASGWKKIADLVMNFFIKLWFEGRKADATLENRLKIPIRNAYINGHYRFGMADIANKLSECCGIPKDLAHYDELIGMPYCPGTLRREFQDTRLEKTRNDCVSLLHEMGRIREQFPDWSDELNEIQADLVQLSAIPVLIWTHPKFPNQLERDIRGIFQDVGFAIRPRIAAAAI